MRSASLSSCFGGSAKRWSVVALLSPQLIKLEMLTNRTRRSDARLDVFMVSLGQCRDRCAALAAATDEELGQRQREQPTCRRPACCAAARCDGAAALGLDVSWRADGLVV